ncbi:hypothetical protein GCM10027162_10060 [Streptomyces incanus]
MPDPETPGWCPSGWCKGSEGGVAGSGPVVLLGGHEIEQPGKVVYRALSGAVSCSCGRFSATARREGDLDVCDAGALAPAPGMPHRPKDASTLVAAALMSLV